MTVTASHPRAATLARSVARKAAHFLRDSIADWTFGRVEYALPFSPDGHSYGFANEKGLYPSADGRTRTNIWFKAGNRVAALTFGPMQLGGAVPSAMPKHGEMIVGAVVANTKRSGYRYEWWCSDVDDLLLLAQQSAAACHRQLPRSAFRQLDFYLMHRIIHHCDVRAVTRLYDPANPQRLASNASPHAFMLDVARMCNCPEIYAAFVTDVERAPEEWRRVPTYPPEADLVVFAEAYRRFHDEKNAYASAFVD